MTTEAGKIAYGYLHSVPILLRWVGLEAGSLRHGLRESFENRGAHFGGVDLGLAVGSGVEVAGAEA